MFSSLSFSLISASLLAIPGSAAPASQLVARANPPTVLAIGGDGNGITSGAIVQGTFLFQCSGTLIRGNCPPEVLINDCFHMYLAPSGDVQRRSKYGFELIEERYEWAADDDDLDLAKRVVIGAPRNPKQTTSVKKTTSIKTTKKAVTATTKKTTTKTTQKKTTTVRQTTSKKTTTKPTTTSRRTTTTTRQPNTIVTPTTATAVTSKAAPTDTTTGVLLGSSASPLVTSASPESSPASSPEVSPDSISSTSSSSASPISSSSPTSPLSSTSVSSTTTASASPVSTVSPRQRIELYSWPPAPANSSWNYSWKTFLNNDTQSSTNWFHLWQILRRDANGGPVVSLENRNNQAVIVDLQRPCTYYCTAIPLSSILGRTVQHNMNVTFGLNGTVSYTLSDLVTGSTLLAYSAMGDMGSNTSIKFGTYRAAFAGMTAVTAYAGDYSAITLPAIV